MKSRTISSVEYLRFLQLEFLSYSLRANIYEKEGFIKMCKDISKKKKEKIISVGKRFNLLTIFDSQELFDNFLENEFNREFGLPRLQYVPETEKYVRHWDKYYLLSKGKRIVFQNQSRTICDNWPDKEVLCLSKQGNLVEVIKNYTDIQLHISKNELCLPTTE